MSSPEPLSHTPTLIHSLPPNLLPLSLPPGRMFKTLKILRLTKMTKTLKAGMMSEAMEELTTTTTNRSILRFAKLMVLTFIVCHWFTCMWVRVSQARDRDLWPKRFRVYPRSLRDSKGLDKDKLKQSEQGLHTRYVYVSNPHPHLLLFPFQRQVGLTEKDTDNPSWIKEYDREQETDQDLYLSGFYLVSMTLTYVKSTL